MKYIELYGKSSLEHQGKRYSHNSLLAHLLSVAASARVIFEHPQNLKQIRLSGFSNESLLVLISALHDIGKCSRLFQRLLNHPDSKYSKISYDRAKEWKHGVCGYKAYAKTTSMFICHKLSLSNNQVELISDFLYASCAHHGKYPPEQSYSRIDEINESSELKLLICLVNDLIDLLKIQPNDIPKSNINNSFIHWFAGWVVLADWIGSDSAYFKPFTCDEIANANLEQIYAEYYRTAKKRINELNLFKQGDLNAAKSFPHQFEKKLQSFGATFNPMQQWALSPPICSGKNIIICEVPMGAGKTEFAEMIAADLISKQQVDGMIFALPTQGSANQIHTRLDEDISKPIFELPCNLGHSNAKWEKSAMTESGRFGNESQRELIEWIFHNNKRCFLAPISVVTVDQLELAVLNCKHSFLRAAAISRHLVVIDEVHAYDAYMSELIDRLLGFLGKMQTPVVLLSATLPSHTRERLFHAYWGSLISIKNTSYPRISWATENDTQVNSIHLERQTAPIEAVEISFVKGDAFLNEVISQAQDHCVCIICNSVLSALDRYQKLLDITHESSNIAINLFHSRYVRKHRQDKEVFVSSLFGKNSSQKERQGQILIATQVVEQSLDLDFDFLYSEIAPIDLILQRLGRLHRHLRTYRSIKPVMSIILPADEDELWYEVSRKIYNHPEILKRTIDVLQKHTSLCLPKDLGITVSEVYDALPETQDIYKKQSRAAERSFDFATEIPLIEQIEDTDDSSKTRDSADSIDILLLMVKDGTLVLPNQDHSVIPKPISEHGKLSAEFLKIIHPYIISVSDSNPKKPDTLIKKLLTKHSDQISKYFQNHQEQIKNNQTFFPFNFLLINEYNDRCHFDWGVISGWHYYYKQETGLVWERNDER